MNDDVREALDRVVDPCSSAIGVSIGLASMGLVTSAVRSGRRVDVVMRLTSPCCAYGPMLADAARVEVGTLPDVDQVTVTIDHRAVWTEADLARDAAAQLAQRRRTTIELTGVRPHDWSTGRTS